jgi:hypothetical protein
MTIKQEARTRKSFYRWSMGALCALAISPALAAPGAIWTTLSAGQTVNTNLYDLRSQVYLNGGPLKNSGKLPDGDYYFMVTDPSGAKLLSKDDVLCRRVSVVKGAFKGSLPPLSTPSSPCSQHANGTTDSGGATPVQLAPFWETPNDGGEYKAWLIPVSEYKAGTCSFGFCGVDKKSDNFKVKPNCVTVNNTATLVEVGRSSSAQVTNCREAP